MALSSGHKRGYFRIKSSDSESDIPLYKKERITRAKRVTRNLQTFCDNDSPVQTSTDNIPAKRRLNEINKSCNRSIRPSAVHRTRIMSSSSESDTTTVERHKTTRGRQLRKKKSNVNVIHISDSSWNSTDSLIENKKKFLRSSNVNKQNNSKDSESEFIDCSQVLENKSKEKKDKQSNIVSSTPIGDNRVIEKQKQDVPLNFKPHVTKIMEEMKCKFARFISQISRLQERYFKEEIVSLEDAKDIIFILTCIISRLKEEFSEHQHKLMDFCFQSSMNFKRTVSNIQDKQFLNDNHLQVQSLINSPPNSRNASSSNHDESVFSENTYVERSLQPTKSSTNDVQLSSIDLVSHKDNKKSNTKSALETNNCPLSVLTNEDNIEPQNKKSTLLFPNNITKNNDVKGNVKGSIRDSGKTKDSQNTSTFQFREPVEMTRNLSKNILNSDNDISQRANSDVDSTCSTLNLFFSYNVDKEQNNQAASSTNEYENKTKNNVLDKITLNARDGDTQRASLHHVSSCENIFSDRNSTKRSSISNKEKFLMSNNSTQTNSLHRIHSVDTMIFPNQTDTEDTRRKSIYRFNSEETLIIPNRTSMSKKNCSFIKKKKRFPISNENLMHKPDFEFIVPNADNLNNKCLKYVADKKLQMNCRVLIEKCNL